MSPLVEMMLEKFQFLFLEAVCLIRSFIVQIVFPKNDLSEVSWWGIYGLRGRKTINCFCQMRTRAFPFLHLICPNQTGDTCCVETFCWDFCRVYFTNGGCANLRITSTRGARAAPENHSTLFFDIFCRDKTFKWFHCATCISIQIVSVENVFLFNLDVILIVFKLAGIWPISNSGYFRQSFSYDRNSILS